MKQHLIPKKRILSRVLMAVIAVLLITSFSETVAYARQITVTAKNELYGTSGQTPPEEPPEGPTKNPSGNPNNPSNPNNPNNPNNPSNPSGNPNNPSNPAVQPPKSAQPPDDPPPGPFDPADAPKTADGSDPKPLLAMLAIGVYLLRQVLFSRKRGGGAMEK